MYRGLCQPLEGHENDQEVRGSQEEPAEAEGQGSTRHQLWQPNSRADNLSQPLVSQHYCQLLFKGSQSLHCVKKLDIRIYFGYMYR